MQVKIFILDSECAADLGRGVRFAAERAGIDVAVETSWERSVPRLPRDHDGYLLHLSNVTEDALVDLRETQPWSKIYGICGMGYRGSRALGELLDGHFPSVLDSKDFEKVVRSTNEIYSRTDS